MKNYLGWLAVLAAGWVLGWMSHQYWPPAETLPVATGVASRQAGAGRSGTDVAALPQYRDSSASKRSVTDTDGFNALLATHRYRDAVQQFDREDSVPVRDQYRTKMISHLEQLLARESYVEAERLLSVYLGLEYRDVDVLLIRARLYYLQSEYDSAIDALYQAKTYEYRPPYIEQIGRRIRALVAEYDKKLQSAGARKDQLGLYERLVSLEPDYSPFFIALAQTQLALGRVDDARQSLALVQFDPRVEEAALRLMKRIDHSVHITQPNPVSVPLIRQGEHFIVEAWLNNTVRVRLLIDTGATMTVMRRDVLNAAAVSMHPDSPVRQFNSANGVVQGTVYRAERLAVGEQIVNNIEVAGLDLPGLQYVDGLLGMNYLRHFRFFIDQGKSELRLSEPL